jgi:hypothetical protein
MHLKAKSINKADFPFRATMKHADWSPEVSSWLRYNVGADNHIYIRPADAYTYLRYGFKYEEDATAFRLMFSK